VDVLRRDGVRAALLAAVSACDRLVLLGDTLELRHGPLRGALEAAEPVLRELADAVGPDAEVVIVPGNHDHRLLRGWFERRAADPRPTPLGLERAVDWRDEEPLAEVVGWLGAGRVRAMYPGLWLRDDVYAVHGHYADRHYTVPIIERLGAAMMQRVVVEPAGGPQRAEDYETTLGPMYAWIDAVAQSGGVRGRGSGRLQVRAWRALQQPGGRRTFRGAGTAAGWGALVALLNRTGTGPFGSDVTTPELRRAGLRAFQQVLERLGVRADHVIFGHTHRAGPQPGDDRSEWTGGGGSLINTGSWTYDRGFVGDSGQQGPYRPGFCVVLDDDKAPQLVNLLDGRALTLA
jgi:predicted phosphodiesterase